ncbi:predicted protein [Arabidopsis lyrata subsp. lyrata]|uniref:Predicted protein n=1 Tax=Arabidopsis lyrata subsp. lyrata TaxID=81972 RepID=D7LES8_ARALL|nr:predicted protein [Arabidopsis lyrata subsp. lyrata]
MNRSQKTIRESNGAKKRLVLEKLDKASRKLEGRDRMHNWPKRTTRGRCLIDPQRATDHPVRCMYGMRTCARPVRTCAWTVRTCARTVRTCARTVKEVCSDRADVCSAPCPFKVTPHLLPACLLHQKLLGVATGSGDSATHVAVGGKIRGEVVAKQLKNRLSNPI